MQNWDDMRLFLATARAGSSRSAAEVLGLNQSTISRRLRQLEEQAGVRLFERGPGGLEQTAAGQELFAAALDVEERMAAADRRLLGQDAELQGTVRVSMPDMMVEPVAPHLARFATAYPRITQEVVVENDLVSLTHREADVAIRLSRGPSEHLVGVRVGPALVCIYGAPALLASGLPPTEHPWIRWEEKWRMLPPGAWIEKNVDPARVVARVNTSLAHRELIAQGVGAGLQLCYIGDEDARLVRLAEPFDMGLELWVLSHGDLDRAGRVRTMLRFLGAALREERLRFVGEPIAA